MSVSTQRRRELREQCYDAGDVLPAVAHTLREIASHDFFRGDLALDLARNCPTTGPSVSVVTDYLVTGAGEPYSIEQREKAGVLVVSEERRLPPEGIHRMPTRRVGAFEPLEGIVVPPQRG